MTQIKTLTAIAAIVLAAALVAGCARMFTAKTVASYETPDGKKISYESDKEQTGLDVEYEVDAQGRVKKIRLKVDKSGTQESVVAAALLQQSHLLDVLTAILQRAGGS